MGLTQAVVATPVALIGPVAGVCVDRFNRKNVMIASALFQGAIVAVFASLFIAGKLEFPVLLSLVFLLFSGRQFFVSALNAYIPRAVNEDDLGAANSLFSLSNVSNMLMGYVVGGLVLSILGVTIIVVYDCITFFVAACLLITCSGSYGRFASPSPGDRAGKVAPMQSVGFVADFKIGLAYIRSGRLLLLIMAVGIVLTFFSDALIALLPACVEQQLSGSSVTYGLVLAACVVGGMIGSVVFGKADSRRYLGTMFISCVTVSGLAIVALGLNSDAAIALFAALVMGGSCAVANLCVQVFIRATVPGRISGRVYTVLFGVLGIFAPVGAIVSGVFAGYSNPGLVYTLYGALVFGAGVFMFLAFHRLKNAYY